MNYELIPSKLFLSQLDQLSSKTKLILKEKLLLAKEKPSRNKRIKGYNLFLFRIRIEDNKKELRVIYLLDGMKLKIICILNRKNNYNDLIKYLDNNQNY